MSERTQKWILAGVLAWISCGVVPSMLLYIGMQSRSLLGGGIFFISSALGLATGAVMLGAVFVHPRLHNWVTIISALVWFVLWPAWLLAMSTAFVIVGSSMSAPPPQGSILAIRHGAAVGLILVLPISSVISAAFLGVVTKSRRVFVAVIVATVLLAFAVVPIDSLRLAGVYLWNPIVVGSMIVWAIHARIRMAKRYLCVWCGYDRRGLAPVSRCPECGNEPFVRAP